MRDLRHLLGRAPLWLGAASIVVASVSPALAAWEEDLAAQLRWDYDCRVAYYSGVIERLVEGQFGGDRQGSLRGGAHLRCGAAR